MEGRGVKAAVWFTTQCALIAKKDQALSAVFNFNMLRESMTIIGNEQKRASLLNLARRSKLHHCLLFEGPSGIGKKNTAIWLAKILNCEEQAAEPCNRCWHCKAIDGKEHPDIIEISPDPNLKTQVISVSQARQLIKRLQTHTFRAQWRVVIFDPAETMRPATANALLKTFEEPPSFTIFILICKSAYQLITTIRSRSQRVRFVPVAEETMKEWLGKYNLGDNLPMILSLSEGCPQRALALIDGELDIWRDLRKRFVAAVTQSTSQRFAFVKSFCTEESHNWDDLMDIISTVLYDTMLFQKCQSVCYNKDMQGLIEQWSNRIMPSNLNSIFQQLDQIKMDRRLNVNARLLLDSLMTNIHAGLRG